MSNNHRHTTQLLQHNYKCCQQILIASFIVTTILSHHRPPTGMSSLLFYHRLFLFLMWTLNRTEISNRAESKNLILCFKFSFVTSHSHEDNKHRDRNTQTNRNIYQRWRSEATAKGSRSQMNEWIKKWNTQTSDSKLDTRWNKPLQTDAKIKNRHATTKTTPHITHSKQSGLEAQRASAWRPTSFIHRLSALRPSWETQQDCPPDGDETDTEQTEDDKRWRSGLVHGAVYPTAACDQFPSRND